MQPTSTDVLGAGEKNENSVFLKIERSNEKSDQGQSRLIFDALHDGQVKFHKYAVS